MVSRYLPADRNDVGDLGVCDAVGDVAAMAFVLDEAAPTQAREVVRHPALWSVQLGDQLRDGPRPVGQQLEDA